MVISFSVYKRRYTISISIQMYSIYSMYSRLSARRARSGAGNVSSVAEPYPSRADIFSVVPEPEPSKKVAAPQH